MSLFTRSETFSEFSTERRLHLINLSLPPSHLICERGLNAKDEDIVCWFQYVLSPHILHVRRLTTLTGCPTLCVSKRSLPQLPCFFSLCIPQGHSQLLCSAKKSFNKVCLSSNCRLFSKRNWTHASAKCCSNPNYVFTYHGTASPHCWVLDYLLRHIHWKPMPKAHPLIESIWLDRASCASTQDWGSGQELHTSKQVVGIFG